MSAAMKCLGKGKETYLDVCVAWHNGIDFLFGPVGHDENKVLQVALDVFHLVHLRRMISLP